MSSVQIELKNALLMKPEHRGLEKTWLADNRKAISAAAKKAAQMSKKKWALDEKCSKMCRAEFAGIAVLTQVSEFGNKIQIWVDESGDALWADGDYPSVLHGQPEAIAIFRNLADLPATTFQCPQEDEGKAQLALEIDQTMKEKAQSGWKGDEAKERVVQNLLYKLLQKDVAAMQALFEIIKNQPGY